METQRSQGGNNGDRFAISDSRSRCPPAVRCPTGKLRITGGVHCPQHQYHCHILRNVEGAVKLSEEVRIADASWVSLYSQSVDAKKEFGRCSGGDGRDAYLVVKAAPEGTVKPLDDRVGS